MANPLNSRSHSILDGDEDEDVKMEMDTFDELSPDEDEPLMSDTTPRGFLCGDSVDFQARVVHLGRETSHQTGTFAPNVIRNQKYSLLSFIPMVLYEQFRFFFNMYFLVVALSQFIPAFQVGYLFTYVAPLVFVLLATMLKEGYDDWLRYKRDSEANSTRYDRLQIDGTVESKKSSELCVGDLLMLHCNQRIPADCVLLRCADETGSVFVRTDQVMGVAGWCARWLICAVCAAVGR